MCTRSLFPFSPVSGSGGVVRRIERYTDGTLEGNGEVELSRTLAPNGFPIWKAGWRADFPRNFKRQMNSKAPCPGIPLAPETAAILSDILQNCSDTLFSLPPPSRPGYSLFRRQRFAGGEIKFFRPRPRPACRY